jgi:HAD superfamily hydrolase (TIGR01509 family)
MKPQCCALFDLDGVLLDSEGIYSEFWTEIDRLYPTGIENFAQVIKGNTLDNILNSYFPRPEMQAHISALLEAHEHTMVYRLFDSVPAFLQSLKQRGIPMAIVTSSNQDKMRSVYNCLPGFKDIFDAILTADDVTRSKPDPQGYLRAAAKLGFSPRNCIVFEDSIAGVQAGAAAGASVVGITTTNPAHRLTAADKIIDSFDNITVEDLIALNA